jgi:hypothetical protein
MGMKYENLQWQTIVPELGSERPVLSGDLLTTGGR